MDERKVVMLIGPLPRVSDEAYEAAASRLEAGIRKWQERRQYLRDLNIREVHEHLDGTHYVFADDKTPATLHDYHLYMQGCDLFNELYANQ